MICLDRKNSKFFQRKVTEVEKKSNVKLRKKNFERQQALGFFLKEKTNQEKKSRFI